MKKIKRVIIIDDEYHIRSSLLHLMNTMYPSIEIAALCENVKQGVDAIKIHNPDLVISDVNLPDGTVRDILKNVAVHSFDLVIITASDEKSIADLRPLSKAVMFKPAFPEDLKKVIDGLIAKHL